MTSFDYRLNPIYAIKECSSCGSLYTSNCGCSKGSLEDKILVPKPPRNCARCARCGTPVDGPYCQGCALLRKEFMEGLFTNCVENEFFKDFQDTSESSNDNTNVVNAPREPIVVDQDPGENSSPSPPHIDHCCHECGDSLDGIFCRQCTYCGGPHETFQCQPMNEDYYLEQNSCYDDDEDYTIAITPVLLTEEPVDSLIMEDEHLDTILATESDKVIKSSVEELVPIPSESEGISDGMFDVPLCEKPTPLKAFKDHSAAKSSWKIPICYDDDEDNTIAITPVLPIEEPDNSLSMGDKHLYTIPETESDEVIKSSIEDLIVVNFDNDNSSSDDDSPYGEDIDYVDASPPDVEIVSLKVVEIVDPEVGRIDDDIFLTIKDDILREKLSNVNLFIAKIDALRDALRALPSTSILPNTCRRHHSYLCHTMEQFS
ncbi:hypothetical protein Tco_0375514 [Tanacetum coccineum]